MDDETKLSALPKEIYNNLGLDIVQSIKTNDPDIFSYFEAYEVLTGETKDTSYLWGIMYPLNTYTFDSDYLPTCPKCGARTDFTCRDNANIQDHTCLSCRYEFIAEIEEN